jgi:hypothetical protein
MNSYNVLASSSYRPNFTSPNLRAQSQRTGMKFTSEGAKQVGDLLSVNAEKLVGQDRFETIQIYQNAVNSIDRMGEHLLPNAILTGITPDPTYKPQHRVVIDTQIPALGNLLSDSFKNTLRAEDDNLTTQLKLSLSKETHPPTIIVEGGIYDPNLVGGDHPLTNLEKHVKRVEKFLPQLEEVNRENTFEQLGVSQRVKSIKNILEKHTVTDYPENYAIPTSWEDAISPAE